MNLTNETWTDEDGSEQIDRGLAQVAAGRVLGQKKRAANWPSLREAHLSESREPVIPLHRITSTRAKAGVLTK
jgi:hypothetical protein